MKIQEVLSYLEQLAPPALQESYDNAGLIVGHPDTEISKILVCLDSTPEVVEEAKQKGANLIVAHHPIVFGGLKKLNGKNYVERTVMEAIKADIAIYAIHTNLDNVLANGVNQKIAQKLGLTDYRILSPKTGLLQKLVVFCPQTNAEQVRQAIFTAGAGQIGEYDCCSFNLDGTGTFRAGQETKPHVGQIGELHKEHETRIETVLPKTLTNKVIQAMIAAHPYEEVAYDLYNLENASPQIGSGVIGDLPKAIQPAEFLQLLKKNMNVPMVRYTQTSKAKVQKIALCGGSGSFLLNDAKKQGADVFLTSDFKYHQFFDAEGQLMIADIGHYEGEYFTIELLSELLTKKFDNFAVIFSEIKTNPINYFS